MGKKSSADAEWAAAGEEEAGGAWRDREEPDTSDGDSSPAEWNSSPAEWNSSPATARQLNSLLRALGALGRDGEGGRSS
ncbi:unnamed protein product [Lampetra planeri]